MGPKRWAQPSGQNGPDLCIWAPKRGEERREEESDYMMDWEGRLLHLRLASSQTDPTNNTITNIHSVAFTSLEPISFSSLSAAASSFASFVQRQIDLFDSRRCGRQRRSLCVVLMQLLLLLQLLLHRLIPGRNAPGRPLPINSISDL
ncbi:hypothetical protein CRG98_008406 [Punica granatum]|uniref:Uncharacterized protein n=1 Tax=Punica granatum TaxID=22663 RepID=A0A2I0KRX9_PUNGR|nr:hypothetical protein CRG98_008406 [Punica granatum]